MKKTRNAMTVTTSGRDDDEGMPSLAAMRGLLVAVIRQAAQDLKCVRQREEARAFFAGDNFGYYCQLLELEPGPLRERLRHLPERP